MPLIAPEIAPPSPPSLTKPTFTVEIAFTTNPLSATPAWTDVSQYVIHTSGNPIHITRGRSYEMDTIQPGTLSLTLRNNDGRFTPERSASPYYPNVKPLKRIRVTARWGATTDIIFDGHVDRWPHSWELDGTYGIVRLTATDALILASRHEMRSLYEHEIINDSPLYYWTLGDPSGSTFAAESSGKLGADLSVQTKGSGATIEFGSGTGPAIDGLPAVVFTSGPNGRFSDYKYLQGIPKPPIPTSGSPEVSYEVTFRTSSNVPLAGATAPMGIFGALRPSSGTVYVYLLIDSTDGKLVARWVQTQSSGATVTVREVRSDRVVWNAQTHHAIIRITDDFGASTSTLNMYIDGTFSANATFTGGTHGGAGGPGKFSVGTSHDGSTGRGFDGTLSHMAIFPIGLTLTGGKVTNHYQAWQGWPSQKTDERIQKIINNWGFHTSVLDVGLSTLIGQATSGTSVLDAMNLAAVGSEDGLLFIDRHGAIRFQNRMYRMNRSVGFTLPTSDILTNIEFWYDHTLIRNSVEVSQQNGSGQNVVWSDSTSIATYDVQSETIETVLSSDQLIYRAQAFIGKASTPRTRCNNVSLIITETLAARMIILEIGDAFAISGLPSNALSSVAEFDVDGIEHDIINGRWEVTISTSPRPAVNWLVTENATYGQVEQEKVGW